MVRAKMVVQSVEDGKVNLACQYDADQPEDEGFCQATPWGEATMAIDNPPALAQFSPGVEFYVDFTPCNKG